MSTLTIRNVNAQTHARLRERAARNGRSVEAEVRAILDSAAGAPSKNFLLSLHDELAESGGFDIDIPPRLSPPRPVDLP